MGLRARPKGPHCISVSFKFLRQNFFSPGFVLNCLKTNFFDISLGFEHARQGGELQAGRAPEEEREPKGFVSRLRTGTDYLQKFLRIFLAPSPESLAENS